MSEFEEEVLSPLDPRALEKFKTDHAKVERSREVCVCGHSMNFHSEVGGGFICSPAKMTCKCSKPRPVLTAENLRLFMYSTTGVGAQHALGKGILASISRDSGYAWLEDPIKCDRCLEPTDAPIPVSAAPTGVEKSILPIDESGTVDKIVCVGCYTLWTTPAL